MRAVLLGLAAPLAAAAIPAAPAAALDPHSPQFAAGAAAGVSVHRGGPGRFDRDFRRGGRDRDRDGDRRRLRRARDLIFVGPWYESADFDGNRGFDPDRWNDWWHERPWLSYPRWVHSNEACERVWQGGGVWRCEW